MLLAIGHDNGQFVGLSINGVLFSVQGPKIESGSSWCRCRESETFEQELRIRWPWQWSPRSPASVAIFVAKIVAR